jgi:hypothetical protein
LGYREEGEWVALALEMDLRGYGDSFEAALAELQDVMKVQIQTAFEASEPESIFFPAEAEYFDKWNQAFKSFLKEAASGAPAPAPSREFNLRDILLPFLNGSAFSTPGFAHAGA